ncbi:MAG TPA: asparaginase domain-containing protein [Burkholderiales bacterium]|nr:asparaginase domain-containing protein [Burkholderiales bacterium]
MPKPKDENADGFLTRLMKMVLKVPSAPKELPINSSTSQDAYNPPQRSNDLVTQPPNFFSLPKKKSKATDSKKILYLAFGEERKADALLGAVKSPNKKNIEARNIFEDGGVVSKDIQDSYANYLFALRNEIINKSGDSDSIVISHDANEIDKLPGTAFFLQRTLPAEILRTKKIVLTGSMKAADEKNPDGPENLSNSLFLADSDEGKGVLVQMDGKIFLPFDVDQTHTQDADSFQSVNKEIVGTVKRDKVEINNLPNEQLPTFNLTGVTKLPAVVVIHADPHSPPENTIKLIRSAFRNGAEAVVYAGTGNGEVHSEIEGELERLATQEQRVIIRSSIAGGAVVRNGAFQDDERGTICSGKLGPDKAALLAQMALAAAKAKENDPFYSQLHDLQGTQINLAEEVKEEVKNAFEVYQHHPHHHLPAAEPDETQPSFPSWEDFNVELYEPEVSKAKVADQEGADKLRSKNVRVRIGDRKLFEIPYTENEKVEILYLGTGGTISSKGTLHTYTPELGAKDLLEGIKLPHNVNITARNLFTINSKDIGPAHWLQLRAEILKEHKKFKKIVISHGTDTLANTLDFLRSTLPPEIYEKIVMTGAMKPSNVPNPDGPKNLSDAFFLAKLKGVEGAFMVMNGKIFSVNARKGHTTDVDAFKGEEIGRINEDGKISMKGSAGKPEQIFELEDGIEGLSKIQTIRNQPFNPPEITLALIDTAVKENGAKAIVYAGEGNGKIDHKIIEDRLKELADQGITIIRSSKVHYGPVIPRETDKANGITCAGNLGLERACMKTQLGLTVAEAVVKAQAMNNRLNPGGFGIKDTQRAFNAEKYFDAHQPPPTHSRKSKGWTV